MSRYVDADALQDKAYKMRFNQRITERELALVNYLIGILKPIDAVSVVRGEWINTAEFCMSDNIVCSVCGYDSIADYNYCPNCGANMREREDE